VARFFYLTPMLGGPGAPRYPISDQPLLIGRSDAADIPLLEPTVSRQHATIQSQGDAVLLKDLGSKHGTFVNSRRVGQTKLKVGDIVVFGLSLVLRLEETDRAIAPPAPIKVPPNARESEPNFDPAVTAIRTVTIPPRSLQRPRPTEGVSVPEVGRIHSQLVKMQKLASAGAHCLVALPEVESQLATLRDELRAVMKDSRREVDPAELLRSVEQLLTTVEGMSKALAVAPPATLDRLALADIVRRATMIVDPDASNRQVKLLTDVDRALSVQGDGTRLVSALVELMQNAIKASPQGGVVELVATRSSKQIVLAIIDQGSGFAKEVLDRLFDPFVTRSSDWETLGLGLFEARQIVCACGGAVQVESKRGAGSTVRVVLPALDG
jgi:signal transduction histidine kinase